MDILCKFSCDIFGGYEVTVSSSSVSTPAELTAVCVNDLLKHLDLFNLTQLVAKCKSLKFHIHDVADITSQEAVYVCSGCSGC